MGKTSFILSIARNIAIEQQKPIAIFSLEMSAREISMRFVAAETDIASETFKTRKLTDQEWERLVDKTSALAEAPIFIDDSPHISMFELRAKCRRLKQKENIQMIFVDYLQLMEGDTKYAQGNREQEISKISRQMKSLSRELEIPVMILSQLNRNVEQRGGTGKKGSADNSKTPQLSDLRESGAIEQDADIVLFIHRPEYYKILEDDNGNSLEGIAIVNVAKHRSGKTGDARLRWIGSLTKFENLDHFGISTSYDPNKSFEPQERIMQSKMNSYDDGPDENFYDNSPDNIPF
jgi:replicative DNA helicase